MGATGAGKSTLMNVMTSRNLGDLKVSGELMVNGKSIKRSTLAGISAYIQQENILMDPPLLFFDEPTSGLDSFLAQQMVALMKSLAEKGKTIVSIIHQPSSEVFAMFDRILLLAEGRTAFTGMSKEAVSFFRRIGYECPPKYNPADFYIHTLAIVPGAEEERKERVSFICDAFRDSEEWKALEDEIGLSGDVARNGASKDNSDMDEKENEMTFKYKLSWFSQFRAIFTRCWTANLREPFVIKLRLFQTLMLALLLGVIFFRQDFSKFEGVMNVNGAIFLFLISGNSMYLISLLNLFSEELPVFLKEHQSGMYRVDAYFTGKIVAEFPLSILFPAIFTAIVYFMIGLNGSLDRFVVCALIMIIISNVVTSCSYMISCLSSTISTGIALASLILLPMLLVNTSVLSMAEVHLVVLLRERGPHDQSVERPRDRLRGFLQVPSPWRCVYLLWLKYISWFYYGNEALMINQWKDLEIDCGDSFRCLPHGDAVLSVMHFDVENHLRDIFILFTMMIVYNLMAYLVLRRRASRRT
ncbi:unnamed protein product [Darwinula stevensoni]|uniref:Uncharacterized protein n=1 Tax=Darwinula stevensoni TaxID=69355 RepID=A0A7R8ZY02_9CRUS|nr:unnamed protein product [Darwinula stevensoni]CAG0879458.1 unnamed protein product [Darwinula stevensoni]